MNNTNICKLLSLSVCDYSTITDLGLRLMEIYEPLKVFDITGTACSIDGIRRFQENRPDVQTIYNIEVS